jgi:Putative adhesin
MAQKFNVSENPRIEIRGCDERVAVLGWDDARTVSVDGAARQEGDTIVIENLSRVNVRVPRAAAVTITQCDADVAVRDLSDRVELAEIDGDVALNNLTGETLVRDLEGDLVVRDVASLKGEGTWEGDFVARSVKSIDANDIESDVNLTDVGVVTIKRVGDDLSARDVHGALTLDSVDGDVSIRAIDGELKIGHIDGDLIVSESRSAVNAPEVEGDAVISLDSVSAVELRADGDVVANLPSDANAELELAAPRGDLVARANIQIAERDANHLRGTLGSGGTKIQIESTRGDLILRAGEFDHAAAFSAPYAAMGREYAEMGHQIAEQVRESVQQSLGEFGMRDHRSHPPFGFRFGGHRRERDTAPREPHAEEKPRGPAAGTPERQAILDAIARGELNVDDAIKKLTGEK